MTPDTIRQRAEAEALPPLPGPTDCKHGPCHFYTGDQMRAYARATLAAQRVPLPADIAAKLRDPVAVHAAMLRGEIATPAIRDMLHVYGGNALARRDAAAQPVPE